jgi:hypothetical protein
MPPVDRAFPAHKADDPVNRLVVSLRSYVTRPNKTKKSGDKTPAWQVVNEGEIRRMGPTGWVLVFDCETTTTPDQRLKFGTYQLRNEGRLAERGILYEPEALTPGELAVLQHEHEIDRPGEDGEEITFLTRQVFVEQVFYAKGFYFGAQIVGFNLPFDISRLAVRHTEARRGMAGGFSFVLIDDESWPRVAVRHLSQRTSFIRFTGVRPDEKTYEDDDDEEWSVDTSRTPDRGYFVDVKTLAAALTSGSHSLESLSELLKIPNPKLETEGHGGVIDPDYVHYARRDTQATWECFEALDRQFQELNLTETGLYDLYSEASLGKAYLRTMGIKPWRKAQEKFLAKTIGQIISTYYGGRSEVHIRREIVPVIHFDFLSEYPSVCTLMNLWRFVIATGIKETDDTDNIKRFVAGCTADTLQVGSVWKNLNAIVQVVPQGDLFPVRARYGTEQQATIGLNYLTSDEPVWFTLADVLVSKILTGKTPKIVKAMRFNPLGQQESLTAVAVAGKSIDPSRQDFYKELIIHRLAITKKLEGAKETEKQRLESDRLAIKILANATSYGIFVELNVKDYERRQNFIVHGARGKAAKIKAKKFEEPGSYFHPLLGTLITGAARLMLALAERQVLDQGLDWAFCDTDSIAIADSKNVLETEFTKKALAVQEWFSSLNPYGESNSILQLEKVNFPKGDTTAQIDPPYCLTVSAKRYALFNRDDRGEPVIRKASGHGLGHLFPPYDEPPKKRRERIKRIGVPLWQEDVWRAIISAMDSPNPDQVPYGKIKPLNVPAASRYAATTKTTLKWFDGYNNIGKDKVARPYPDQVKPFNFLLSLEIKSKMEMANTDMAALSDPLWFRREPRPAAPYSDGKALTFENAFDRDKPEFTPIPASWLKTYARSLVRYHLHSEAKFWGGHYEERGTLRRRHVYAVTFQPIGKEADKVEEGEYIDDGDDHAVEHPLPRQDQTKLRDFVLSTQDQYKISDREISEHMRVSRNTVADLRRGRNIKQATLMSLVEIIERIRLERINAASDEIDWFEVLQQKRVELGSDAALAKFLDISRSYATRLVSGGRPLTESQISILRADLAREK